MIYKGYEIVAEVITERAEYSLDDNGNLYEWLQNFDTDQEISYYGIVKNGDVIDWADTLKEVEEIIDELSKEGIKNET